MDKRLQYIGIGAIAVFGILFTILIAFFVVSPLIEKQKLQKEIEQQQAQEFKAKADSIAIAVDIAVDSIVWKHTIDSLTYEAKNESLVNKYTKKIQRYETRLADIDTMDIQLNSSFSVRNMLSDSACKVW